MQRLAIVGVVFVLLFGAAAPLSAQKVGSRIEVVSTAQGLPSPFARAVARTPSGVAVSLMAAQGVGEYAGAAFVSDGVAPLVTPWRGAAAGFSCDRISALRCATDGTLWAATDDGLYRRTMGASRFVRVGANVLLRWLDVGSDGVVWAAGQSHFVRFDTRLTVLPLPPSSMRRPLKLLAARGKAWLICEGEVLELGSRSARALPLGGTPLERSGPQRGERRMPRLWIFDGAVDANGALYLIGATRHLVRYARGGFTRLAAGHFSRLVASPEAVYAAAFDGTVRRWNGTSLDVVWQAPKKQQIGHLYADEQDRVWLEVDPYDNTPATVLRLSPKGETVTWRLARSGSGVLSPGVLDTVSDGRGGLWITTNDGVWHLIP